jgi:hypothetical protein
VGEPVPGRAVVQLLFGQIPGVGLGDGAGLDRGQHRGELLDRPTTSTSSSSERADHRVSARPRTTAIVSASTPAGDGSGTSAVIDIGIGNQPPPTFQPISTTFIPVSEISTGKEFRNGDLGPTRNRNHKEHLKLRRTREPTSGGTATESPPPPNSSSFTTATPRPQQAAHAAAGFETVAQRPPQPAAHPERPPRPAGARSDLLNQRLGRTSPGFDGRRATSSTSRSARGDPLSQRLSGGDLLNERRTRPYDRPGGRN